MNKRTDFIIPECYIDTNLIETLVCTDGCNHQKGCNQVAKVMQEKFSERFAVGIIDADKRRPGYIGYFNEVAASKHLKLYRHIARYHFIILVHPAADGFILDCAAQANIDITKYGLPNTLKEFTVQTKNIMSNKDIRFKHLFKDMENIGEIKLIKSIVSYLVSEKYNADNDHLISLFNTL